MIAPPALIESVTGPFHTVDNHWETTRDALDWKENKAGSTVISKYDYGVNAIGQRTSVASTGTAFGTAPDWNWQYNARGELVLSQHAVTTAAQDYSYDGIGNRTAAQGAAYSPNSLNQYDDVDGYALWYDDDGNLESNALNSNDYFWDGENRLQMVSNGSNYWSRCLYDAFGRRVSQGEGYYSIVPDSYDMSSCVYWVYDGWNQVAEYTGTPHSGGTPPAVTLVRSWVWGGDLSGTLQGAGGVGGLLAAKVASTMGYPLYDGNGNVCQYLNGTTVIAKYEYDGFGRTLAQSGTHQWAFPHRFSTKYQDYLSWLYYYGYRYYDPVTGRWPSRDPIEEAGGVNLYGFVGNASIYAIDVLGLFGPTIRLPGQPGHIPFPPDDYNPEESNCAGLAFCNPDIHTEDEVDKELEKCVVIDCDSDCPTDKRKINKSKVEVQYTVTDPERGDKNFGGEVPDFHVSAGSGITPQQYGPGPVVGRPSIPSVGDSFPTRFPRNHKFGKTQDVLGWKVRVKITKVLETKCYCCDCDEEY